jgi:anti-anti-sigma factor
VSTELAGAETPIVVTVSGRVDAANAPELLQRLQEAAAGRPAVVIVDLGQVSYISSSGLRVLLLAHREQLAAGAELLIANVPQKVGRILAMAGFDQVFHFAPLPTATG